jgi:hypothetical protein
VCNACIHTNKCIESTYYTRIYLHTNIEKKREWVVEKVRERERKIEGGGGGRERERVDTDTRCFVVGW